MLIEELTKEETNYILNKRAANKIQELQAVIQGLLNDINTKDLLIKELEERLQNATKV